MGFFDKIKASLARTKQQFVERFDDIVRRAEEPSRRARAVDVDTVDALEEALISADVGVAATDQIIRAVRDRQTHGDDPDSDVTSGLHSKWPGAGPRQDI